MKEIPTLWDETLYIDGYPGEYCVLARRHGDKWYVAGINAGKEAKKIKVQLPMFAGESISFYSDHKKDRSPQLEQMKIKKDGEMTLTIQPEGGVIFTK
jgi:hypothetical protein